MKKVLVFTIVLAILSAGFLAGFSSFAAAQAEPVVYTPESFFGDLSVLSGLSMEHEFHLDHRMSWSSSIDIEGSAVLSESSFERASISRSVAGDYSRDYSGISIYSDCDQASLEKIAEKLKPIANGKQDYVEADIPLTDIGDNYPLQIAIAVPGLDAHSEGFLMGVSYPGADEAIAALLETFRIPADEDAWVHVMVAPDPAQGSSTAAADGWWMSDKGKQLFCTCPSVICGNICYFAPSFEKYDYSKEGSAAFAAAPEGGNHIWAIDFSYSISENGYYTDGKLDASSLRRVFETGDEVRTNALYKSADGKNLHVMTSEPGGEWISTISLEDGVLLQREYLAESPATAQLAQEEDFLAMTYGSDRLTCVKFCEDGLFDIIIDCPLNIEEYDGLGIDLYSTMNSFEEFTPLLKDDMLIFSYLVPRPEEFGLYRMRYCSTDIGLIAYCPEGLLYAGRLNCSMEPSSTLFYNRDLNNSLQNISFKVSF